MYDKNKDNKLVVIEGTDGSGKATQQDLLVDYLQKESITYASFDFPQYGKTFFGDFAGRFLNGEFGHFSRINPYLASFPYAADRWQARNKLWEAVEQDKLIVCNRYTPSAVYQAVKVKPKERHKFFQWIETLEYEVFNIPKPQLVIFLYLPWQLAQILIAKKKQRAYLVGKSKDQYEESSDYLIKVEKLYLKLSKENKNWYKINCFENEIILPPKIINQKIISILEKNSLIPHR